MTEDEWARKIMEEKYPRNLRVFYNINELETAVLTGKVGGPVGLVYHAIISPVMAGMTSRQVSEQKREIEWRLKRLGVEVIVFVSLDSFMKRFQ